ncbi:MAG: transcriptional regulator [Candidatus Helarchaeota archaeon]
MKNILPAIKALMVKELNTKWGKSQKEIAKLLGITQPSVSYYLHGERGGKAVEIIKADKKTFEIISDLAKKLVITEIATEEILKAICTICLKIRSTYIQKVCPDKFEFLEDWNVCFRE